MKDLVETCERVAATQGKLTKVATVAAYLVSLSQEELPVATRFLTGQLLPPWGAFPWRRPGG